MLLFSYPCFPYYSWGSPDLQLCWFVTQKSLRDRPSTQRQLVQLVAMWIFAVRESRASSEPTCLSILGTNPLQHLRSRQQRGSGAGQMQGHIKWDFFLHSSNGSSALQTRDGVWLLLFCIHSGCCLLGSLKPQCLPPWWGWLGKMATALLRSSIVLSLGCG